MKIVATRNKSDIDIQFLDENKYVKRNVSYQSFKLGQIRNPYDKVIYGMGYVGIVDKTIPYKKYIYDIWHSMLGRCYDKKTAYKYKSYHGIATVCEEWLCFRIFSKWFYENEYKCNERLHIDKDILLPGNKLYSPNYCILIPQRINMLFTTHRPNKYGLPEGISLTSAGKYGVSYQGKSFGTYETLEDACLIHTQKKEEIIKLVAEEYKDVIPKRLYDVLCNYKVDVQKYMNRIA